jgi:hypothetical protein
VHCSNTGPTSLLCWAHVTHATTAAVLSYCLCSTSTVFCPTSCPCCALPPAAAPCRHADHESLKLAKDCSPKQYPKPDGVTTFDIATSLYRSGAQHLPRPSSAATPAITICMNHHHTVLYPLLSRDLRSDSLLLSMYCARHQPQPRLGQLVQPHLPDYLAKHRSIPYVYTALTSPDMYLRC